jgi:hypothetical protein
MKLKMFENPELAATMAQRAAAPPEAERPQSESAEVQAAGGPGAKAAQGAESEDSGLFADVGDDYEVDVTELKKRQEAKAAKVLYYLRCSALPLYVMLL